jgi:RNA polymerase sigma-70 factor, ECF subfamily
MKADTLTDQQVMAQLGTGQTQTLALLVERHQKKALCIAQRILGHRDMAEDAVQDAFVRVYRGAPTYRPKCAFSTWFYRILVNLCIDRIRRQNKQADLISHHQQAIKTDQTNDPAESNLAEERKRAVHQAIGKLNERERTAVMLHRFEGFSHQRIAEITEWTESAVESLLVRAYKKLRQDLEKFK